jgi:hypothetical protein
MPSFQASDLGNICDPNLFTNEPKLFSLLKWHNLSNTSDFKFPRKQNKLASSLAKQAKFSPIDQAALAKFINQTVDKQKLTFNDADAIRLYMKDSLGGLDSDDFDVADPDQVVRKFKERSKSAYAYLTRYRGRLLEKPILSYIKSRSANNLFNFKKHGFVPDYNHNDLFTVKGRVDGMDLERRMLVEIKTRWNFSLNKNTVSLADHVQVLVYMKLFDCSSCLFVECGPNGRQGLKETMIKYDAEQFEEYMHRVERFCKIGSSGNLDFADLFEKLKQQINVIYI